MSDYQHAAASHTVRYAFSCPDVPHDFVVAAFECTEELDRPYRMVLELAATSDEADSTALLGRDVTLGIERNEHALTRAFYGVVDEVTIRDGTEMRQTCTVVVVPALASLGRTRGTRIFQGLTSLDIVTQVLTERLAPYKREIDTGAVDAARLMTRDYCVQYSEPDLDFVHRLLEEEGIGYYFDHDPEGGPEKLVLFDDNRALSRVDTMDGGPVRYDPTARTWAHWEPILRLMPSVRRSTTAVTVRDHDWTRHDLGKVEARSEAETGARGAAEVYEHGLEHRALIHEDDQLASNLLTTLTSAALPPGTFPALPHQVQSLAGALLGSFTQTNVDDRARARLEAVQRDQSTMRGIGLVRTFAPGKTLELLGHPTLGADGEYYVTKVVHSSASTDEPMPAEFPGINYHNRFEGRPLAIPWRPERRTRKPRIDGIQTATVTGPAGMDIFTDASGRIKVRFHWDRASESFDGSYTCWMRVSQAWAGNGSPGFMFIPRVGMEVVVSFIDGDPDRPLVTGCVYNGHNATPGLLPVQATKSFIRTQTVPHGPGHNEISFEDAMGMERVHIRAQRDLDELVLHNHVTDVRASQAIYVGQDQVETVGHNQKLDVHGERIVQIGGDHRESSYGDHFHHIEGGETISVGQSYHLDIEGGSYSAQVEGGEYHVAAGGAVIIDQGGERSILLSPDDDEKGITIRAKDSKVFLSEDKIELTIGGSIISMTSSVIRINGKTFPASGGSGGNNS